MRVTGLETGALRPAGGGGGSLDLVSDDLGELPVAQCAGQLLGGYGMGRQGVAVFGGALGAEACWWDGDQPVETRFGQPERVHFPGVGAGER